MNALLTLGLVFFTHTTGALAAENCTYQIVKGSENIAWTGFKYTEKTGVGGSFDALTVESKKSKSVEELLKSISFKIDTESVNSGNPARDATLKRTVFKFLSIPKTIKGEVLSVKDKVLNFKMTLNEEMEAQFGYSYDKGELSAKGAIDLTKNGLLESFNAVHESCKVLHTGKDGVSKTWADVKINLKAQVEEKCSKGFIDSIKDWFDS
jgi:hypothetical protein